MKGPGYTFSDLIFYSGLMGGFIITYLATAQMDLHRLVRLLIAAVVGAACGWAASKLYGSMTRPLRDDSQRFPGDDDRNRP
jgi:hypothetical protein